MLLVCVLHAVYGQGGHSSQSDESSAKSSEKSSMECPPGTVKQWTGEGKPQHPRPVRPPIPGGEDDDRDDKDDEGDDEDDDRDEDVGGGDAGQGFR